MAISTGLARLMSELIEQRQPAKDQKPEFDGGEWFAADCTIPRGGSNIAASERACISNPEDKPMVANNRSAGGWGVTRVVARELDQLKRKVKELTLRLEREAKARKLEARLAAEAKKARQQLTREIKALREQGGKLASQLKSTLGDASKREQALKKARAKVAELTVKLGRKSADLGRKSGELKKLAGESAHRAAALIRGEAQHAAEPVEAEPTTPLARPEAGEHDEGGEG